MDRPAQVRRPPSVFLGIAGRRAESVRLPTETVDRLTKGPEEPRNHQAALTERSGNARPLLFEMRSC
jgi:hypothetical protein